MKEKKLYGPNQEVRRYGSIEEINPHAKIIFDEYDEPYYSAVDFIHSEGEVKVGQVVYLCRRGLFVDEEETIKRQKEIIELQNKVFGEAQ